MNDLEKKLTANLLVVDDNPMNRDVLCRRLERQGYVALPAEDGKQALTLLRSQPFDLVYLDIMMPGMDGYEVLETIKSDTELMHLPVIMISALDEMESVVRCIKLGAEDYLPKPFNPTLLQARTTACLEKKRAHDREQALFQEIESNYRKLQQLEKQRDDLTHMIVHDLRTPLTSVISGLQTLEAIGTYDDIQQECIEISRRGGETLLGMINDLLDISKMESGTLVLERGPVDILPLVTEAQSQVTALARESMLTISGDVAPDLPILDADREKLRRVLVNLLGNAIKFTPSGGQITVGTRWFEECQETLFTVHDTGRGIPQEAFEHIFEKFGQVSTPGAPRARMSTGLGLTFCKMAVEAHGGRIWVESELGQGSTFSFTIPTNAGASSSSAVPTA